MKLLEAADPNGVSVGIEALVIAQGNCARSNLAKCLRCEVTNRPGLEKLFDRDSTSSVGPTARW